MVRAGGPAACGALLTRAKADMVALDLFWRHKKEAGKSDPTSDIVDWLCEKGRFGQKTRAGYYDYDDMRRPHPNATVDQQILQISRHLGIERRTFTDQEIVFHMLGPLVNEGFNILHVSEPLPPPRGAPSHLLEQEGIAARPGDIDVVYCYGYGFPEQSGGPMHWAERFGLCALRTELLKLGLVPSPLFDECVSRGISVDACLAQRARGSRL